MSTTDQLLWYTTRGAGTVTLVLLTISVVLGLLTSAKWQPRSAPRFLASGLHRNISLLALAMLVVHVVTAVIDPFAKLGITDAIIPFTSSYRRFWLGLGVVAAELLVAITITSLVRLALGHRNWKLIHWTAYACWPLAVVHGFGTGTDAATTWMLAITNACVGATLIALAVRLAAGWPSRLAVRVAGALIAVGVTVWVAVWVQTGPLQHGWARIAGTPANLLASGASPQSSVTPAASAAPAAITAVPAPLNDRLSGNINGNSVDFSDLTNPALTMTLTPDQTGSQAQLIIQNSSSTICNTVLQASFQEENTFIGNCGNINVQLRVSISEFDSSVTGVLRTATQ